METRVPSITAGLAFMDSEYPGWRSRVNPNTLDIGDACNCILAQAGEGDYNELAVKHNLRPSRAVELGIFVIDDTPGDDYSPETEERYDALTHAWRAELQAA